MPPPAEEQEAEDEAPRCLFGRPPRCRAAASGDRFAGASRVLQSQLFEMTATDPLTIAAATLVLALVTCVAGLLPARRASRVDPAATLRYE